jgi:mannose-6-phosphate isomerase-like protein (cupin superfamily)
MNISTHLCLSFYVLAIALQASPEPTLEVVSLEKQPWYTAEDKAVAREVVSPRNSRAQQMSIADIIIPPGVTVREHHHKVIEEVYFVTGGEGYIRVNGVERLIKKGDAVVIRPGERHNIRNASSADLHLLVTCTPAWTPDCLIFDPEK